MIKTQDEIERYIELLFTCALRVLEDENELFRINISERSLAHRFAIYIKDVFENETIKVDCEYNRHLDNEKRLLAIREIVKENRRKDLPEKEEEYGICVSPDIVIHQRRIDDNNQVIIEIKKNGNPLEDESYDIAKINGYLDELNYQLGIFVKFKTGVSPKIDTFKVYINASRCADCNIDIIRANLEMKDFPIDIQLMQSNKYE